MGKGKQKSLTVLFCLLSNLRDSEVKSEVIDDITNLLVESNVCTEEDVCQTTERFDSMVSDIEGLLTTGVSYNEAYKRIRTKYPEFNINLN